MGKRSRRRGEPNEPQDAPAEGAPGRLRPDGRLREVALLVEEADYLFALYRWIVVTGEVPRAQDWLRREEWPHPDYVIDVFGSWEKFLQHAEIPTSPLLARLREAEEERRSLAAREQQAERDLARVEDLRRQVETAKRRREAADAERGELRAPTRPRPTSPSAASTPRRPPGRAATRPTNGSPPTRRCSTSCRPSVPTARSCCARSRSCARRPHRTPRRSPASAPRSARRRRALCPTGRGRPRGPGGPPAPGA